MHILGWIVFGAFVGWLANGSWASGGSGCMVNIALGLVGALAGGFLFQQLSGSFTYDQHGFIVSTLVAVIGAVIVLAIWNAITGPGRCDTFRYFRKSITSLAVADGFSSMIQ